MARVVKRTWQGRFGGRSDLTLRIKSAMEEKGVRSPDREGEADVGPRAPLCPRPFKRAHKSPFFFHQPALGVCFRSPGLSYSSITGYLPFNFVPFLLYREV